jgi:ABC-type dipeptide/oligopeptide/nickel transport system ATPase component
MPDPLLSIADLTVEFPTDHGPARAVDRVSLAVARGEVLGVVGESGCGKSMTALSVLRLVPPPGRITSGEIRFVARTRRSTPGVAGVSRQKDRHDLSGNRPH